MQIAVATFSTSFTTKSAYNTNSSYAFHVCSSGNEKEWFDGSLIALLKICVMFEFFRIEFYRIYRIYRICRILFLVILKFLETTFGNFLNKNYQ